VLATAAFVVLVARARTTAVASVAAPRTVMLRGQNTLPSLSVVRVAVSVVLSLLAAVRVTLQLVTGSPFSAESQHGSDALYATPHTEICAEHYSNIKQA
jgi:hypothetical protein